MPVVNPAHQFLQFPKTEVGTYALDLARLAANKIPLPPTYCIPISTLKKIGQANNLQTKFNKIANSTDLQSQEELEQTVAKIQNLIRQQVYPHQISKKLLQFYAKKLDKDYIRLTASPVDGKKIDFKREDNIKGEANMMESILNVWALNIDLTDIQDNNLFPVAIVMQAQTQPISSGLAYSMNINNGDKSKITISSVFGVYAIPESEQAHDTYIIDQRSWQISQQTKAESKQFFKRQPDQLTIQQKPKLGNQFSLSTDKAIELAHLVKKIKLTRTEQIKIHWELQNDQLLITKIKPYHYSSAHAFDQEKYTTLVIGHGVTSGFVSGRCFLIEQAQDVKAIKPGMIAVVKELTREHQKLLQVCSAIICETTIKDQLILNKIRDYSLPVIISAQHALKQLRNEQLVTVDAAAGKVYQVKSEQKIDQKLTVSSKTKLYLAVNNFDEISEKMALISNGIGLLRSEHLFIKTGLHPQQILKTRANQFQKKTVNDLLRFYHRFINLKQQEPLIIYRSNNLNANQLAQLESGHIYENIENNPYLGFRGGIRYLNQNDWFKFELKLLTKINQKIDKPVNLQLPFVRSAFELNQLFQQINNQIEAPVLQPPIWLEIDTPENLLNVEEYLQIPLAGISINIKNIHALLNGIDPGFTDIYNQYTLNHQLLIPALKNLIAKTKEIHQKIKIHLILPDFSEKLLQEAKDLGIEGVIVRPEVSVQTKKYLIEHETTL